MWIKSTTAPILIATALAVFACKKTEVSSAPGGRSDLGSQAAGVVNDTQTTRDAQTAVNDVIRSTGDCDKIRETAPGALRAIDDAYARIQTVVGRQTLDGLRKQVEAVQNACPPS
jgi:hypothetical protein